MKGSIFCTSQASTAICLSHMDHILPSSPPPSSSSSSFPSSSSSSSASAQLGGRAIDRHNPIIRDSRRAGTKPTISAPCSSSHHAPINPTPYHQLQKTTKKKSSNKDQKRKSCSVSSSVSTVSKLTVEEKQSDLAVTVNCKKTSANAKLGEFITPPGSSRYLLSETDSFDGLSDLPESVLGLIPVHVPQLALDDQTNTKPCSAPPKPYSSSRFKPASDQVVVLRVSLHCKGCERKVRKHLSRMEGVTSYNIDFVAKKVTIVGNVTPLDVLASVSNVKSAQFWTSTAPLDNNKK